MTKRDLEEKEKGLKESKLPRIEENGQQSSEEEEEEEEENENEEDLYDGWHHQAGMVERVRMKNFMCHAELNYKPTNRLNFLSGANGSGKSAILAAIVFGLGGTARMSNRGSANKSFIRTGQSTASVEITLYNRGENAYKPELFGKSLTVVRSVNAGGGGSYKLKSERGQIVTEKRVKQELDRILSQFNIQVDNPIAILNQDTAKTFLFKCQPDKLYQFFMKATQLDECRLDYNSAAEEKNKATKSLEQKEASLVQIKADVDVWEKKFQFFQTMEAKKEKLKLLKAELAWSVVGKVEEEVGQATSEVSECESKVNTGQSKMEELSDKTKSLRREKVDVEKQIQVIASEADRQEKSLTVLKQDVQCKKVEEKAKEKDLKDLTRQLKQQSGELKCVEEALCKIKEDKSDRNRKVEENQQNLKDLDVKREALEAQMQSTRAHLKNLNHSLEVCRQEGQEIRAKCQESKCNLSSKKKELNQTRSQSSDQLVLYGNQMPMLVKEIEKAACRFKKAPIGPLGIHIKLAPNMTKLESSIIESELGNLLKAFLVDNFDDRRILDQLCQKCKISLPIITCKFANSRHDVSRGKCQVPGRFKCLLDRLEIENASVANCLIDNKKAEQILLIGKDADAQELLKSRQNVPPNCLYALTSDFNQFYPAPMYRSYAFQKSNRNVLQNNVDGLIGSIQKEIDDLEKVVETVAVEQAANEAKQDGHSKEMRQAELTCAELRSQIGKVSGQMFKLKADFEADKSPDLSALEEDQEKLAEEVQNLTVACEEASGAWKEGQKATEEAGERLKEGMQGVQEKAIECEPLTENLDKIEKAIEKQEAIKVRYLNKVKGYSDKLGELKASELKAKELLSKQLGIAKGLSVDRIETRRTPKAIHRELSVAEEGIRRQQEVREPKEVVSKTYKEKYFFHQKVKDQVTRLRETIKHLDRMLRLRKKGFLEIRGSVSRRVKMNFAMRLQARNFIGQLTFDHTYGTLEIVINPEGGELVQKRAMKTLSGGEKSYSTVALVLALWESIQPPFRILDEFDVFMDMMNRRIALDQIIAYAQESRQFQYIFLTPLTMKSVDASEDLQIIYLQKNSG